MYKHFTTADLIQIADRYATDNWQRVEPDHKWNGFDLVGDTYIFQLSYWGSIGIFDKETVVQIQMSYEHEDILRQELGDVSNSYIRWKDSTHNNEQA